MASQDVLRSGDGLSAQTIVFVLANVAIWFGVINSAREITKELPIYMRERIASVGVVPYLLSKIGLLVGLVVLQTGILLAIVGLKAGYPSRGLMFPAPVDMYVSLVLAGTAATATGLLISALVSNEDRAMTFVPFVVIPQFILAGVSFKLQGVGAALSQITLSRWGTHSLGSIADICMRFPGHRCPPQRIHLAYTHSQRALAVDWAVLLAMSVGLLVATGIALKRRDPL